MASAEWAHRTGREDDDHVIHVRRALVEEGYDLTIASEWAALRFDVGAYDHLQIALAWDDWGFSPQDAYDWVEIVGPSEFEEASTWHRAGFLPQWAAEVLRSADNPTEWLYCDLDPGWCAQFVAAGVSLKEAQRMYREYVGRGLELQDALAVLAALSGNSAWPGLPSGPTR